MLFYSPISWIILIVFSIQTGLHFSGVFDGILRVQMDQGGVPNITMQLFSSPSSGLFSLVQSYLYLYIPLLTMSSLSREFSSGSIKLLYSSPVTTINIVISKFLALVLFGVLLMLILLCYVVFTSICVESADVPAMLAGLLGLFLMLCAYIAIGLFMSSLTSYNVVAALGTFCVLGLLNYAGKLWQDVAVVQDIAYWLVLNGRSSTFISGMITSEDVLYFIIVTSMFLGFTILKLNLGRKRASRQTSIARFSGVFLVAMFLGYFSSLPKLKVYADVTNTKRNTLSQSSIDVMERLNGDFTIHNYVNLLDNSYIVLPGGQKNDINRFAQYVRFKPEIKMKYHYYYKKFNGKWFDSKYPGLSDEQLLDTLKRLNGWKFKIDKLEDMSHKDLLKEEDYRFTRVLERGSGEKTVLRSFDDMLRFPSESEITSAVKRLVMELPLVAFVKGHGERESSSVKDNGLNRISREKAFRNSLINQGFDFTDVTLDQPVPDGVRILIVADPRIEFSATELKHWHNYLENGGNALLLGEPDKEVVLNPITAPLGIEWRPGVLVNPNEKLLPHVLVGQVAPEGSEISFILESMKRNDLGITMPGTSSFNLKSDGVFAVVPWVKSAPGSWIEVETKDFQNDSVVCNAEVGEVKEAYPVVVGLSRDIKGKSQRILVSGDADWMSNGEQGNSRVGIRAANPNFIKAAFFWLSNGEVPIDIRKPAPTDVKISLMDKTWDILQVLIKWCIPLLLIIWRALIWKRRRGR